PVNQLIEVALSNTLIAAAIAIVALATSRRWKNPHVARALWIVVIVKLVMPPLFAFPSPFGWLLPADSSPSVAVNEQFAGTPQPLELVAQAEVNESLDSTAFADRHMSTPSLLTAFSETQTSQADQ